MEIKRLLGPGGSFFAAVPAIMWQVLFLFIPLSIIVGFSLWDARDGGLTLKYYWTLFDWMYVRIIIRSVLTALFTAFTCLFLAYPVSYFLAIRAGRWRGPLLFLSMVPFWTNFLVQVYAWFFLLEYKGIINTVLSWIGIGPLSLANSVFSVLLVMVYCYLPFMIISLYIALERLDIHLLEASADLGASTWQTFMRITLPLSLPGIKAGMLLVLIPSFGEFTIPALLGGSHAMFAGSLISYYALVVRDWGLCAAFTGLSVIALAVLIGVLLRILGFMGAAREDSP